MQIEKTAEIDEIEVPGVINLFHTLPEVVRLELPLKLNSNKTKLKINMLYIIFILTSFLFLLIINLLAQNYIILTIILSASSTLCIISLIDHACDFEFEPKLVLDKSGLEDRQSKARIEWVNVECATTRSIGSRRPFRYVELKLREAVSMTLPSPLRLRLWFARRRLGKDYLIVGTQNYEIHEQIIRNVIFALVRRNGGITNEGLL